MPTELRFDDLDLREEPRHADLHPTQAGNDADVSISCCGFACTIGCSNHGC